LDAQIAGFWQGNLKTHIAQTAMEGLVTLSIRKNKVAADKVLRWTVPLYVAQVQALLDEVDLPDMDFKFSKDDHSPVPMGSVGIFRTEGQIGEDLLLIPRSVLKLDFTAKTAPMCAQHYQKAVFRGSLDGPKQDNARYFAANFSKVHPDLLDAGFTNVGQWYQIA
jgi:hypothetical protein